MTLFTALAFVALGFVAGCFAVGLLWKAMTEIEDAIQYKRGFEEGLAAAPGLLCGACGATIEAHTNEGIGLE